MSLADTLRHARNLFMKPVMAELGEIRKDARRSAVLAKERYIKDLLSDPRYADPLRLEPHGAKVCSQFDEDGIIQEIFRRIGTTNKTFVEFGVGTGVENNTAALLLHGWRGLWIEGSEDSVASINQRFADVIADARLTVKNGFIDAANINELIGGHVKGEIDLLSIDIDGNDYYVFEAIDIVRPRAVVMEYNGKFTPDLAIVQAYNPHHRYRQTDYYGGSLAAFERLFRKKGYALVGCNLAGANAFFVRADLAASKFQAPFTAENHFQPARYHLWQLYVGGMSYLPDWGAYVRVSEDGTVEGFK